MKSYPVFHENFVVDFAKSYYATNTYTGTFSLLLTTDKKNIFGVHSS